MEQDHEGGLWPLAADVACLPQPIVNLYFVGRPDSGDRGWTLIDAGLPGTARWTRRAAEARFGPGARPAAIILTHGHFDHVGGLPDLAKDWDVPIYAHPLELPYLTGGSPYPPPDPTVGGGAMARLAPLYPRGPFDFRPRVHALPADGSVPSLPGWRVVHTPGHAPGHVSFFREADCLLLAGDAFVTTKQESALAALLKPRLIHGPPAYFTPDWGAARRSIAALAALRPAIAGTGHGKPLAVPELTQALDSLLRDFDRRGVPSHGRYVGQPAVTDERGVVSVPPPIPDPLPTTLAGLGAAGIAALVLVRLRRRVASGRWMPSGRGVTRSA